MPNSNLFTHRMLFSREKPPVKSTALGSILYHIYFEIYFYLLLFLDILFQKPKIPCCTFYYLFYLAFDLSIFTTFSRQCTNFWHRYPKGIDNPFNTPGCEDLLSVCRGCLRCVAWFDNLGFISEGNTYRCCAASSLPLWENTDVAQAASMIMA